MFSLLVLLAGCKPWVIKDPGDGALLFPAEPLPPPEDFAEVEKRLDALLDSVDDAHRRDRLLAARDLARHMKTQSPQAQRITLAYLREVVAIEERSQPVEAPVLYQQDGAPSASLADLAFTPIVTVTEESLDEPEPQDVAPQPRPAPSDGTPEVSEAGAPAAASSGSSSDVTPEQRLQLARSAMEADDPQAAMDALEPCHQEGCWDLVAGVWGEARDRFVFTERERAGALYLASRGFSDPLERATALDEVRTMLADLLDRYPDSRYADAIRRNIDLVQRELEALDGHK